MMMKSKKMNINSVKTPEAQMNKTAVNKRLRKIARQNRKVLKAFEQEKKKHEKASHDNTTIMKDKGNLLEIDNLHTYFYTDMGVVKAVNGVSFNLPKGKTVAVVGESGCGKSVTSLSLMRLVQGPTGHIVDGEIRYNRDDQPIDIVKTSIKEMRKIRGNEISMIFQEPMTSLNPVFTIGYQIDEIITLHKPELKKKEIKTQSIKMLKLVGIARAEGIYDAYPHELSGGMRQRAMIAMSLACDPKLIIADEPTTALDVTIQAQILEILKELKDKVNASIVLITHDLGVVAEMADYVVVMYAGRVVEKGSAIDIYKNPKHPYTKGLLNSKPSITRKQERLYTIPGSVPNPIAMPDTCFFKDRCESCIKVCESKYPELISLDNEQDVACWLYAKEEK